MKKWAGIFAIFGAWTFLFASPAFADRARNEQLAELLFPETKDAAWMSVSKAPVVPVSRLIELGRVHANKCCIFKLL